MTTMENWRFREVETSREAGRRCNVVYMHGNQVLELPELIPARAYVQVTDPSGANALQAI